MTRHRPTLALALLGLATAGPLVDAWAGGHLVGTAPASLGAAVAGYLVGAWLRPTYAAAAVGAGALVLTAANQVVQRGRYSALDDLVFFLLLLGGTALAGALVTARSAQVRELRRLAVLREEQRVTEVRAAVLEERNRVEAEVTASLMQRIGAVVVQASGARTHPEAAALVRIEEAGRASLDELRAALGSLRSEDPSPTHEASSPPDARIQPLGPVDVLVATSGVPVAVEAYAAAGPLALVAVLVGLPLLWRRRRPLLAVALALAAAVVTSLAVTPLAGLVTPLLPLSVAAYAVGAHARGRSRVAGVLVLVAGTVAVGAAGTTGVGAGDGLAPTLVWVAVAVLAGAAAAQHTVRATRLAGLLERLETGRDSDLRLAVAEQRQAVARDLHDTVAHAMTVVCLHAEAAQRTSDPAVRARSLEIVESASRDAMTQLRTGLEVLDAPTGLADEVLAFAATLGVTVHLDDAGVPASPLARRVVREALVNAARHAPGAPVTVRLRTTGVEVLNPGATTAEFDGGTGSGLTGLAALVTDHGGRLEHGRLADGGFRVAASLPGREVRA